MLIRSILTIAVLASFVFGAAAQAEEATRSAGTPQSQIEEAGPGDRLDVRDPFASAGGLGTTR